MNDPIKEFAELALKNVEEQDFCYEVYCPEGCQTSVSKAFAVEFAKLIVKYCQENPMIYLLYKNDKTGGPDVLHGWTDKLDVLQKWNAGGGRNECHTYVDLHYVNRIVL